MSDEENKLDNGTTPTSGETPKEEPKTEPTDDKNEPVFDYEKELERYTAGGQSQERPTPTASKRTPAEKATFNFKGIVKELEKHGIDPRTLLGEDGGGDDGNGGGNDGPKPVTTEDVEAIIEKRSAAERERMMEPILDSKITPITRSKGEAGLVKHFTKMFTATGIDLDEAVEMGWVLANRHRFKQTFAEIMRGKSAEAGKGDGTGSGQRRAGPKTEPTGKNAEFAKSRGLVWDDGDGKFISPARKTFLDKQRNSGKNS